MAAAIVAHHATNVRGRRVEIADHSSTDFFRDRLAAIALFKSSRKCRDVAVMNLHRLRVNMGSSASLGYGSGGSSYAIVFLEFLFPVVNALLLFTERAY